MRHFFCIGLVALLLSTWTVTAHSFGFGDNWTYGTCDKCVKKDSKGKCTKYETIYKKHVGVDKYSKNEAGYCVYAKTDLYYIDKWSYSDDWKTGIFMYPKGSASGNYKTYSVLHIESVPSFKKDENLKNKLIGRVATSLNNGKSSPHIHIGYRKESFYTDTMTAKAGALPPAECVRNTDGYPAYKEKFDTPDTSVITVVKPDSKGNCKSGL